MTHKFPFFLVTLMFCLTAWAGPVSQQQAKQNVKSFLVAQSKNGAPGVKRIAGIHREIAMELAEEIPEALYVFNIEGGGYVVAAADDRVPAVIGYADNGSFDAQQIPDNMRAYLNGITSEIKAVQQGLGEGVKKANTKRETIAPLLTSKWNQGKSTETGNPYNYMCPELDSRHCLTGCVATAMAQVMRYHEWPKEACLPIDSYTIDKKYDGKSVGFLDQLPSIVFDWENMKDSYNDEAADDPAAIAVAQLMRYCGQNVGMEYSPGGSSASASDISIALKKYFFYDEGIHTEFRSSYTVEEWNDLIYHELAEKRPVAMGGSTMQGGHSFVCDGYDSDDYFHINWGWGGSCNGCFLLSVLNPWFNPGATEGAAVDSYSFGCDAIVGVQPPLDQPNAPIAKMLAYNLSYNQNDSIRCEIWNRMDETYKFDYGYATKAENGEFEILHARYGYSHGRRRGIRDFWYNLKDAHFSDGTYNVYVVSKESSAKEWIQSCSTFFTVEVKDGKLNIWLPEDRMTIEGHRMRTDGHNGLPQKMIVTVKNPTESEFNGRLYLFMEDSKTPKACMAATISGGQQRDFFFTFTTLMVGDVRYWLATDDQGLNLIDESTVTIAPSPKEVIVMATPDNLSKLGDEYFMTAPKFNATLAVFNNTDEEQHVEVYARLSDGKLVSRNTYRYDLKPSEYKTASISFNVVDGYRYYFNLFKDSGLKGKWQDTITFKVTVAMSPMEETGIEPVTDDAESSQSIYYDLQGRRVKNPTKGIYIMNGKKVLVK